MNPLTGEWVEKAEADLVTAQRELRARRAPNYDAACFHAQQTAEKYLKAFLQENGAAIPFTHNLTDLLQLCLRFDASFQTIDLDLRSLNGYAVRFRYPGEIATRVEAKDAVKAASNVRKFTRMKLDQS
jgi:HEPN domain-containing protein